MADLFTQDLGEDRANAPSKAMPLAERLRPQRIEEVIGQHHICGPEGTLTRMIENSSLGSMVFWGPPGTGKTTVARLLAGQAGFQFQQISAIFPVLPILNVYLRQQKWHAKPASKRCFLWMKFTALTVASKIRFCLVMEKWHGYSWARTRKPSFELNAALLSRARSLNKVLDDAAIEALLLRAEIPS